MSRSLFAAECSAPPPRVVSEDTVMNNAWMHKHLRPWSRLARHLWRAAPRCNRKSINGALRQLPFESNVYLRRLFIRLYLRIQASLSWDQAALIRQHAKGLTRRSGVREDNTANTYYWRMDYITSPGKPGHGKYSVSLGNGFDGACVAQAVLCISAKTAVND